MNITDNIKDGGKPFDWGKMAIFLLITFLLPFISIIMQSAITNTSINFILYGIQAASPTIATITIISINRRVKEFFKKMFHSKHLVTAVVLPVIIAFSTMFLAKLLYCILFKVDFKLGSISFIQFIVILWALVAEELGWRGFLEPFLKMKGISKWLVPFIVGMVWCMWHYHFFLMNGMQVPILLFLISCIIESYIYSFLMECTNNNLVSAMTYHFMWNLAIHIFTINPADNNGNTFPYIFLIILETLVMMILLLIQIISRFIGIQIRKEI